MDLSIALWTNCAVIDLSYVFAVYPGQHIVHTQEQPPYRYELDVHCKCAIDAKVYVIDDKTHSTMLLASEY